ncbi:MAG: SnoaL-like domain-containing protein, partial [Bacteroidota bacterium]
GRETQRQRIAEWNQSVEELHDGGIRSLCVNADGTVATIETYYEMTWQGGMRGTMEEVAVQQWKDGRVVHERFYYWVPAEMQNPEPLSGDNA